MSPRLEKLLDKKGQSWYDSVISWRIKAILLDCQQTGSVEHQLEMSESRDPTA